MPDFPTAITDIPDANTSETLFTMHGGQTHVAATNRILLNLRQLATKLGTGASSPGAGQGVLRRTATGISAWDLTRAGDHGPGSIATVNIAADAITQAGIATGTTIGPVTTVGTPARIPEMVVTLQIIGGTCLIAFMGGFQHSVAGGTVALDITIDGGLLARREYQAPVANQTLLVSLLQAVPAVAAGSRTFEIKWLTSGPTAKAFSDQRGMSVTEFKR